jgi:tetratricopeptide (TPR) repeat protein
VAGDETTHVAVEAESVGVGTIGTVTGGTFILNFYAAAAPPSSKQPNAIPPCPYKGLAFFGPADADRFFGREAAIERLEQAVARQSFTALVGASGSGKSSVVLAGLAPKLHKSDKWKVTYFRIGAEPDKNAFRALARALAPLMGLSGIREELRETEGIAEDVATGVLSLANLLGKCRSANPGKRILVIADQFEEVFTLVADATARARFIDLLLAGFSKGGPTPPDVALVLTLRADFYEKALLHHALSEALQERVVNLGPMTREELREAIEAPAKPVTFDDGLVGTLLDDVETQPGALPLLQFALTEMWGRLEAPRMTYAAYEAIGGVKGALRKRAEDVYARLTDQGKDAAEVARFGALFTRLVSFGEGALDTRRAAEHDELGPEVWGLAQQLAGEDSRLVVIAAAAPGKETVEIVHEALIANWPALRGAIDANRAFGAWLKQLRVFLAEHRNAPADEGALLRGGPLAIALDWREKRGTELSAEERRFIERSEQARGAALQAEVARRHAERRRTQWVAGVSTAAAIVMAGLLGVAVWQWRDAATQRGEAVRQRATALVNAMEAEREKAIAEAKEREAVEDKAAAEAAKSEAERQKLTAEASAKEAEKQKTAAERSLRLATEAANGLVLNLALKFRTVTGVPAALVKDVLDRARDLQQKLIESGQTSPDLLLSEGFALDAIYLTLFTQNDSNGALEAARKAVDIFASLLRQAPNNGAYQGGLWTSYFGVGAVQFAQGQLTVALGSFRAILDVAERGAKSDPGNEGWQQALSTANSRIGDVQVAQGQLAAALGSYRTSLAIADRVAQADPGAVVLQQLLALAHQKIGDVEAAQGQREAALTSYQSDLAIMQRLGAADPNNTDGQQLLAWAFERIGNVQISEGQLSAALASYQSEFRLLDPLTKSDPGNSGWQSGLSESYNKIGDVQRAQGQLAAALNSYEAAQAILGRLAKFDPANTLWQFDLAVSDENVGDVQLAQGQLSQGLASFQASLAIRQRLADSDPGNLAWQREVGMISNKVGDVQVEQDQPALALGSFETSHAIAERLAKSDPGNVDWRHDLSVADNRVGGLQLGQGEMAAAQASFLASLDIITRLADSEPGNAPWQRDLAFTEGRLALVYLKLNDATQARKAFQAARDITARIVALSPDNAEWKDDLVWFEKQLATLKP